MHTMTLKAADAVSIASLIHAADTSRGNMAPVLGEINLTLTAGQLTATATDRFCAISYQCPADGADGELRINAAAAKFVAANVKPLNKWHTPAPVVIEYDSEPRTYTLSHNGASIAGEWVAAKYPGVLSLITEWRPADLAQPVTLKAEFMARLGKFLSEFKKVELWAFELGANTGTRTDRPGPIRATAPGFRFLLMPNLYKPVSTD
jgi:hypothetical protein